MTAEGPFQAYQVGELSRGGETEVVGKLPDSRVDAGQGVQLLSSDNEKCEPFDGTGDLYGVAIKSADGDHDYVNEGSSEDRLFYPADEFPVPILKFGSKGDVIVQFLEAASEGEGVVIEDGTALWRPDSTGTGNAITQVTHAEVRDETFQAADGNHYGSIRFRPTEA